MSSLLVIVGQNQIAMQCMAMNSYCVNMQEDTICI
jgi:hypothetical protein